MIYTLENVLELSKTSDIIKSTRVFGSNKINQYKLLEAIQIRLSNNQIIIIPKGYIWDLSSVPRFLWSVLAPDGDFQLAALIHDFLYEYNLYSRKFADNEMLLWSQTLSGTSNSISIRNIDNYLRFYGVRWFGWWVWYDYPTKISNFFWFI